MSQCTTILQQGLCRPCQEWKGKGKMGWCHGFKLHLLCNDLGEIITFCFTGENVDDGDERVWSVFFKELFGKVFADTGDTSKKNSLKGSLNKVSIWCMVWTQTWRTNSYPCGTRYSCVRRYIIECINDLLKIKANLVHFPASVDTQFHHESMCSILAAYCFFDNKDPFRDFWSAFQGKRQSARWTSCTWNQRTAVLPWSPRGSLGQWVASWFGGWLCVSALESEWHRCASHKALAASSHHRGQ